jgi:hypothetical protein
MSEYVLYKRTNEAGTEVKYLIKTQLQFGEIVSRASESAYPYEREVLAESDDLDLLKQMRRLAQGEEE